MSHWFWCNCIIVQLLWGRNSCRHRDDHSAYLLQPGVALPLYRQAATCCHRQPHAQTDAVQVYASFSVTQYCHVIVVLKKVRNKLHCIFLLLLKVYIKKENGICDCVCRYQGYIGAALVLGGVDCNGPHLYSIYPHGSTDKLPYVTMGQCHTLLYASQV